ncbi:MAG: acyl-[ACP]--phospholipid O-acyltransferase [Epsilonproteobacteria bacterium]|nr:acyl-[ACP]--phospholipid O-acyltransferase [Campylobacterota bacterium]
MDKLFKIKGFGIYIIIVFLNAMTDLGHKIVLQNTIFKSYEGSELIVLTALVNALILLPFIFLFSPSGYISDKYPKTKVIKISSLLAIFITVCILFSYYFGLFKIAFALTFILAAQSAIYSPAKYGLIKEMVGGENIASANAIVQSVTIISILLGAVVYSIFFEYLVSDVSSAGKILMQVTPLAFLLIGASVIEFLLACSLDKKLSAKRVETKDFDKKLYFNLTYLKKNIKHIKKSKIVWESIIGLSLLWGVSQVVVAIFGEYLKSSLGILNTVVAQGLLTLSGVGMIIGSLFAGKVSKNFIEIGIIPIGVFGLSVTLFILPATHSLELMGFILFAFGFFAGLIIVPLNSLIQFFTPKEELGIVLAGNNFMQNVFMFFFLVITALFGYFNLSSVTLFYLIAIVSTIGFIYTIITMTHSFVRYIIRMIVRMRYRVDVFGIENVQTEKGVLLLGNHISFLDWAMLQIAYPKQIRFVMDRTFYNKWYLKPFLKFAKVIPISSRGSKGALSEVAKALNNGETVAIFPEGHISRNGHLDEFRNGFERAAKDVEENAAVIVPFYLRGLWEDNFSYASKKLKNSSTKEISVSFSKPMSIHSTASEVKKAVFELSITAWQKYSEQLSPIADTWIENMENNTAKLAVADSTGAELSKTRFATGVFLFSKKLKPLLKEQNIGIILPSTSAGLIANMSVLALGKTIVNLNYSSGIPSLKYATNLADIKTVITSKQFITKLKAKGFDISEILNELNVIYMEDIKSEITKLQSLITLIGAKLLPIWMLKLLYIKSVDIKDTAAILFSSGSEGTPKGIELTHQNIMGNIKQIMTLINPTDDDVILGTLPMFHSFGLTVTSLAPLVEDICVACHPDPTDGYGVAKLCAKYEATLMFGTATFYRLYTRNRKIKPLMFKSLKMVVAGAEKLPESTRKDFKAKYGLDIYEGYGATETTPVASVNVPDILMVDDGYRVQVGCKPGTVGTAVPGSSFKIVDPETFEELPTEEAGMILIGGTQIMKGYLKNPQKTKEVIKEMDGIRWYITGDKGKLDKDGFLTILDRYSRFAKLGGEMVSLGLVEEEISKLVDENSLIAVTSVPDEKKGEKLILLLEGDMQIEELKQKIKELDINPLFVPSKFYKVEEIPKLGSGKIDLKGLKKLALEIIEQER